MTATYPVESAFPEPGKLFAERYQIEGLIGTGGHSRVYRARQRGFERDVAVKVLNVERSVDRETRDTIEERFYREARLLSRLRGPNTLRVYDYGRTELGQLFMVSELVDGTDLGAVLRTAGPLGGRRARRIFTQILQGLLEVHAEGFLHRDIKPSNVMVFDHLGERDRVKLLDFGIAKGMSQLPDESGLTLAGFVIGTPGYMSPEQAFGEAMIESSDLFSAGLVAYEMLVGRAPYIGLSLQQVQRSVRSGSPRLPGTLDVDPEFATVVHRCLEVDLAARFESAAHALRELGIAPDTMELAAPEQVRRASNVLTFPMHVDPIGATQIDTLTDAATGHTTAILLPDTGPIEHGGPPNPIDVDDTTPASDVFEPPRKRSVVGWLVLLVLAVVVIIVAVLAWPAAEPGPDEPTTSEGPSIAPAAAAASDLVVRAVRNAELDAVIAAKEAKLTDEDEVMEFDEPDEPEPKVEPRPRPRVTPETNPKPKAEANVRTPTKFEPKPRPEPEPDEEPDPDFDVKMLDEL